MMNMKVGLEKRPLTVKQVDTLTAAILRKGITMNELARKISRTPAECSLIIGGKQNWTNLKYKQSWMQLGVLNELLAL